MSESAKDALVSPEASVSRFILSDFRSYPRLDLALAAKPLVALIGDNGAGKTNLLEALSLSRTRRFCMMVEDECANLVRRNARSLGAVCRCSGAM